MELRYDTLLELAEDFKNKEMDAKARMQVRLSGQFKDAMNAHKRGRAIDLNSLPLVPGLPKISDSPFAKAAAGTAPPTASTAVAGSSAPAPAAATVKPKVHHPAPVHPKADQITGDTAERNQLRFLLTRQQQFKEAALAAKKAGNIPKAKEMLLNSKV